MGSDEASRAVVVLGRKNIQTDLLASILESTLQHPCTVVDDCLGPASGLATSTADLLLIDTSCLPQEAIVAVLSQISEEPNGCAVALFNVDREQPHDHWLGWAEVAGLFYSNTDRSDLIEGLQAILRGGYWFNRELMYRYLQRNRSGARQPSQSALSQLTGKEREVLAYLAAGHTNRDIANRLNISYRTVKTHVYNIYKKLEVNNRVQAIARVQSPPAITGHRAS
jgi:LuxR family transcriptional regulator of csgAB operon